MRTIVMGGLIAASLFGSVGQAETYVCQIKPDGPVHGLIADSYTVKIVDLTMNAVVDDAITRAVNGTTAVATVLSNTAKRLSIKWALQDVVGSRKKLYRKVNYRLKVWKPLGNKVSVVANYLQLEGADTTISKEVSGSGKCKLR